jgi:coproporphyrinogen III oxidase-like Fe-S oxidoreductase
MRGKPLNAKAIDWLVAQGLLTITQSRLVLTRAGRLLTNKIVAELVF